MESLDMRHLAPGIGHAGMEQPQNNFALVAYFIMKILMLVIGLKMLPGVKNIVSSYLDSKILNLIIRLAKKSTA